MNNPDVQVAIYLDNPRGQVLQVSYKSYREYWRLIGWTLQGEAPTLDLKVRKAVGLQAGLL